MRVLGLITILCLFAMSVTAWTPEALKDKIERLPGQPDGVDFEMFGGYIDVRNGTNSIYYQFFTSSAGALNSPVVWTTSGGPGCSGMYFNFIETGPFEAQKDGSLTLRPTRFNRLANVIYVEQPAGVGFSKSADPFFPWTDADAANDNFEFILKFFERYPELKSNNFFLNSESYGGHYLPTLALNFVKREHDLKFKGFFVGNPLVYMPYRDFGQIATYGNHQLLPYTEFTEYLAKCTPSVQDMPNPPHSLPSVCDSLERKFNTLTRNIDPYALDYPVCIDSNGKLQSKTANSVGAHTLAMYRKASGKVSAALGRPADTESTPVLRNLLRDLGVAAAEFNNVGGYNPNYEPCAEDYTTRYFNRPEVIKAINAVPKSSSWSVCSNINYSNYDMITTMVPVYKELMEKSNISILVYSGDNDAICSTVESQMAFANNFVTKEAWKPWNVDGQVNGYRQTFTTQQNKGSLVFTTLRSAGHMTPSTNPIGTFDMFEKFINGKF